MHFTLQRNVKNEDAPTLDMTTFGRAAVDCTPDTIVSKSSKSLVMSNQEYDLQFFFIDDGTLETASL